AAGPGGRRSARLGRALSRRGTPTPERRAARIAAAVRRAAGPSAHPAVALADRAARGAARRAAPARVAAHAAALLREPPAGGRRGPSRRAADAGARRHLDHPDLHAPAVGGPATDVRPISSACLTGPRSRCYLSRQLDPPGGRSELPSGHSALSPARRRP